METLNMIIGYRLVKLVCVETKNPFREKAKSAMERCWRGVGLRLVCLGIGAWDQILGNRSKPKRGTTFPTRPR